MTVSKTFRTIAIGCVCIALMAGTVSLVFRTITRKHTEMCVDNLRAISGVKMAWADQNRKMQTDTPSWSDLRPFFENRSEMCRQGAELHCPSGGIYTIGRVQDPPLCGISKHNEWF